MREAINEINELLRYLIDSGGSIEAELLARDPLDEDPATHLSMGFFDYGGNEIGRITVPVWDPMRGPF